MQRLLTLVVFFLAAAAADTRQVRDQMGPPLPTGTASIAGTVVARDGGAAIRGARVVLTADGLPARVTTADDDGRFSFPGLPAGAYRLWGARAGFVAASYGEKRPGAGLPGAWIVIEAGQHQDQLKLRLARGGVITGFVMDASDQPAAGSMVMALRTIVHNGRNTFVPASVQEVNDQGMYRIHGLQPGEYVIASISLGGLGFSMLLGAMGMPGTTHAPAELMAPGASDSSGMDISATFHPGVTRVADASRVALASGEERAGVDIRMMRESTVRVSGTVRGGEVRGGPYESPIFVRLRSSEDDLQSLPEVGGGTAIVKNGAFELLHVQPGRYDLTASRGSSGGESGTSEWATQELIVAGSNIEGLVLTLEPAIAVTGTVETEAGQSPDMAVTFRAQTTSAAQFGREGSPVRVQNGQFTARLEPGRYLLDVDAPAGWRAASAMFGNVDALDFPLDVKSGATLAGHVTLTRSTTQISGTLSGTLNPATNYSVIAFASDERYWVLDSRRNVAVEADAKGHFSFKNLPAGQYRLTVVEDFDSIAGVYPALLRQIAPTATATVDLRDGDALTTTVRIK